MNDSQPLLAMRGITKRFPGVLANDQVDFDVDAGEVHALLGENGAGKSTLMKMLYGMMQPDSGEIVVGGESVTLRSPTEAIRHGIGMVHQHFMLVPTLTVAENVALGLRSARFGKNLRPVRRRLAELSEAYGLKVDPDTEVWQLAVGERQRVEILKALYREASILVLDEPTAVLTPTEVDHFFSTLTALADSGKGIVFISHKLHEVLALSNRITVLRAGRVTGSRPTAGATREELARLMVGRDVKLTPDKSAIEFGPTRLAVRGLRVRGDRGHIALKDVDLDVRAGEVVGIAGVSGNGQRELAEAIAGLRSAIEGTVAIDDTDVSALSPKRRRNAGLAYVPEERMRDGAIGQFSVAENLILVGHAESRFSRKGMVRRRAVRSHASDLVSQYSIKTASIDTSAGSMSGGNIQKMIIARELETGPGVLLVSQPTRGVDIGAAEYIHAQLVAARDTGAAIIVISEDLDEVLGLADRVVVICDGAVQGDLLRHECTIERLGLLMAGVREENPGAPASIGSQLRDGAG